MGEPDGGASAGGAVAGSASAAELRRLAWRCRRGMKELDVLLERYVRSNLLYANAQERLTFERLLELPDPLLADYFFGHAAAPEPLMAALVQTIVGVASAAPAAAPPAVAPPSSRNAGVGEYR